MTSHSNFRAADDNRAAVAVTVATVGDGTDDGAVATLDAGLRPLRQSNAVGTRWGGDRAVAVGDAHVRPVTASALPPDDETIATNGNHLKSSFPQDAGIQRQGCNAGLARVAAADDTVRGTGCPRPAGMTSHSNFRADDGDRATVVGTVATVDATVGDGAVVAGNGTVPSAAPTDMFFTIRGTGYPRPAGMTSHSDGDATDNDRAVVVGTVAEGGDSVGNGAVATVTVTNPDDETIAFTGNHP